MNKSPEAFAVSGFSSLTPQASKSVGEADTAIPHF
jgi:hypothetical protein